MHLVCAWRSGRRTTKCSLWPHSAIYLSLSSQVRGLLEMCCKCSTFGWGASYRKWNIYERIHGVFSVEKNTGFRQSELDTRVLNRAIFPPQICLVCSFKCQVRWNQCNEYSMVCLSVGSGMILYVLFHKTALAHPSLQMCYFAAAFTTSVVHAIKAMTYENLQPFTEVSGKPLIM